MSNKKDLHVELLAYIENADTVQLNQIMEAVECRYRSAFPEWEVIYVAVHREAEKRKQDIDSIVDLLYRTQPEV